MRIKEALENPLAVLRFNFLLELFKDEEVALENMEQIVALLERAPNVDFTPYDSDEVTREILKVEWLIFLNYLICRNDQRLLPLIWNIYQRQILLKAHTKNPHRDIKEMLVLTDQTRALLEKSALGRLTLSRYEKIQGGDLNTVNIWFQEVVFNPVESFLDKKSSLDKKHSGPILLRHVPALVEAFSSLKLSLDVSKPIFAVQKFSDGSAMTLLMKALTRKDPLLVQKILLFLNPQDLLIQVEVQTFSADKKRRSSSVKLQDALDLAVQSAHLSCLMVTLILDCNPQLYVTVFERALSHQNIPLTKFLLLQCKYKHPREINLIHMKVRGFKSSNEDLNQLLRDYPSKFGSSFRVKELDRAAHSSLAGSVSAPSGLFGGKGGKVRPRYLILKKAVPSAQSQTDGLAPGGSGSYSMVPLGGKGGKTRPKSQPLPSAGGAAPSAMETTVYFSVEIHKYLDREIKESEKYMLLHFIIEFCRAKKIEPPGHLISEILQLPNSQLYFDAVERDDVESESGCTPVMSALCYQMEEFALKLIPYTRNIHQIGFIERHSESLLSILYDAEREFENFLDLIEALFENPFMGPIEFDVEDIKNGCVDDCDLVEIYIKHGAVVNSQVIMGFLDRYFDVIQDFMAQEDLFHILLHLPSPEKLHLLPFDPNPEDQQKAQINWLVFLDRFCKAAMSKTRPDRFADADQEAKEFPKTEAEIQADLKIWREFLNSFQIICLLHALNKNSGNKDPFLRLNEFLTKPEELSKEVLSSLPRSIQQYLLGSQVDEVFSRMKELFAQEVIQPVKKLLEIKPDHHGNILLADFDPKLIECLIKLGFKVNEPIHKRQVLIDGTAKTPLEAALKFDNLNNLNVILIAALLMHLEKKDLVAKDEKQNGDGHFQLESILDYVIQSDLPVKMVGLFLHRFPELYVDFFELVLTRDYTGINFIDIELSRYLILQYDKKSYEERSKVDQLIAEKLKSPGCNEKIKLILQPPFLQRAAIDVKDLPDACQLSSSGIFLGPNLSSPAAPALSATDSGGAAEALMGLASQCSSAGGSDSAATSSLQIPLKPLPKTIPEDSKEKEFKEKKNGKESFNKVDSKAKPASKKRGVKRPREDKNSDFNIYVKRKVRFYATDSGKELIIELYGVLTPPSDSKKWQKNIYRSSKKKGLEISFRSLETTSGEIFLYCLRQRANIKFDSIGYIKMRDELQIWQLHIFAKLNIKKADLVRFESGEVLEARQNKKRKKDSSAGYSNIDSSFGSGSGSGSFAVGDLVQQGVFHFPPLVNMSASQPAAPQTPKARALTFPRPLPMLVPISDNGLRASPALFSPGPSAGESSGSFAGVDAHMEEESLSP